jgi:hypothetical protein
MAGGPVRLEVYYNPLRVVQGEKEVNGSVGRQVWETETVDLEVEETPNSPRLTGNH